MFSPSFAQSHTSISTTFDTTSKSYSILLAEDDPELNHRLTSLLNEQGYIVTSEFSGDDALNAFHNDAFDLVILDVNLPNLDGFELLNVIRSRSQTPVVMLTAYGAEEFRIQG
ncbi:response regulator [Vibrio mexicanus]|uniref:response regulator n=1 Tax=Vibrio mexicanus TaxID=1004326 RepID=UPI000B324DFC|nr:response regulator [Vibrio mexicanus]